jgi:hypothetical protein
MSTEVIRGGKGLRYSGSLCFSIGAGGIGGEATRVEALLSPRIEADISRLYAGSSNGTGARLCRLAISPLLIVAYRLSEAHGEMQKNRWPQYHSTWQSIHSISERPDSQYP